MSPASTELVRRYDPEFPGPVTVYRLQNHLIDRIFRRVTDRYLAPGDVVLDVGCGSGFFAEKVVGQAGRVIGVDLDSTHFLHRPGVELIEGDAYALPIESAVVDLVYSKWVFEHLADPAAAIAEMARVLKPGGLALIITPNRLNPGIALSSVLSTRVKQRLLGRLSGIPPQTVMDTYYRANTARELERLFGEAGFRTLEMLRSADPSYWVLSSTLFRGALAAHRVASLLRIDRFRMHLVGLFRKET